MNGSNIDVEDLLSESGAVLKGHFLLSSGRHSDTYVEKFRLLEKPDVLSILCKRIAEAFSDFGAGLVAGPTTGGIIVAYELARQMRLPALYVESEQGRKILRRDATLKRGSKVIVVDDVLTTGKSIFEVIELVQDNESQVAGIGVLIDRSEAPHDFGCPLIAAHRVEASSYPPDAVPDWLAAIPVAKPGTRP